MICDAPGRQYDPAISDNTVVWTDERNDSGDIYGADISDRTNIEVFEIIKQNDAQQQPAIDGSIKVYVDGSIYGGQIKFARLTKRHGAIDIPLGGDHYGTGPAIDGNIIIWQSSTYGEALGISLEMTYSIADGTVENKTTAKRYDYIQHAIDEARASDQIVVEPGLYNENLSFNGKNLILSSIDPEDWDTVESTIIQGGGVGSVVTFSSSEDDSCLLTGFTITGGQSNRGGGISGNNTLASIVQCIIENNISNGGGGGIASCAGKIDRCIIRNNTAAGYGGGLTHCFGSIVQCIIENNISNYGGGGLFNCTGNIDRCVISSN
ncbi:MAG: hypothetical protein KAR47_05620, partial [Planctomycetes bacterium]|nr:hypothetical protein [Planctomycetota bacterium]